MTLEQLQVYGQIAGSLTVNILLLFLWRRAEQRSERYERKFVELLETLAGIRQAPNPDTIHNRKDIDVSHER